MLSGERDIVSGDLESVPPSVDREIPLSDMPLSCFSSTIVCLVSPRKISGKSSSPSGHESVPEQSMSSPMVWL